MNKEQFYKDLELISGLLEKTKTIKKTKTVDERWEEIKRLTARFMSKYLALYLLLKSNPDLKLDPKYKDFIAKSQHFLRSLVFELDDYVTYIENRLSSMFYSDEWETVVCPCRSAVEAVKEMYQGTAFEEFYKGDNPDALDLNTEDLDDSIEMRAHKEGYLKEDQIPKGIPTSHWWWWSPEEPPSSR